MHTTTDIAQVYETILSTPGMNGLRVSSFDVMPLCKISGHTTYYKCGGNFMNLGT
jgi:hypothetical protein